MVVSVIPRIRVGVLDSLCWPIGRKLVVLKAQQGGRSVYSGVRIRDDMKDDMTEDSEEVGRSRPNSEGRGALVQTRTWTWTGPNLKKLTENLTQL